VVRLRINGRARWLWGAMAAEGMALDIFLQGWRNQEAAEAFLRRLAAGQPAEPRVIVTDKPASDAPAHRTGDREVSGGRAGGSSWPRDVHVAGVAASRRVLPAVRPPALGPLPL
jgi:transposase-like protein